MMRFIRRGGHVNAERLKLQKELFQYNQTLFHGFPHRPSALAYNKKLNLLAIGTRDGNLRLYGKAGVEFQTTIDDERKIDSIHFIENTSQLIIKCEDNSIHLLEIPNNINSDINTTELILNKTFEQFVVDLENDERTTTNRITTLTVHSSTNRIFIATEDGQIHFLNTRKFKLEDNKISIDKVQSQIPKDQPILLGAAEQIIEHPLDSERILIGYNRGQLILWNLENEKLEKFYSSGQQLESVCWSSDGQEFISSHNDGSYIVWNINDNIQSSQQPKILYGPFPCKPITRIYGKSNENLIIFSGGMPRQLHGDRHTVSIIQEGLNDSAKHQVLDLTSKIVDFVVLDQQKALIILAEEELVAIDLNDPDWSQFKLPYLYSVHSSPITFSEIYSDISDNLIDKLKEIGLKQNIGKYWSFRNSWPIQGGKILEKIYSPNNVILITGHENGSVRIWNISDCSMSPLCTINTAKYFGTEDDIAPIDSDEQDEEWPPFKKVGVFDPYSDDPRLGIRKCILCPKTYNLLVAGTAGQVLIFELKDESTQTLLSRETIDLVSGLDFIWKSHESLPLEQGLLHLESGYQPKSIVQLNPPASVTAVALNTDWNLFSVGTTHGFAVFSYELNKTIAFKCTLNPAEVSNVSGSGNLITRKKSFRKSLRESFKKLRKGRSMRLTKKGDKLSPTKSKGSKVDVSESRLIGSERQVEAKTKDGIGSVVRYLYFTNAPIINQGQFQRTLWAGTNAGNVFIYLINNEVNKEENDVKNTSSTSANETTVAAAQATDNQTSSATTENQQQTETNQASTSSPTNQSTNEKNNEIEENPIIEKDNSTTSNLTCILTKEIQLKHHAPVIFIRVIDSTGLPIEERTVEEQNESVGIVRVLICSEEQFKLFNLPTLKPFCKFKLTAQEGSKSRRIHISKFISKSDLNYSEYSIVNITNHGELGIFSLLDLKKQLISKCTKKEDVNGISSLVFANNGEGIFLNSPSEFSRFSLSAQRSVKANCLISETVLDKIVIEVEEENLEKEKIDTTINEQDQTEQNEQLNETTTTNKSESSTQQPNEESNEQQTTAINQENNEKKEKPKNVDNNQTTPIAKVTEVKDNIKKETKKLVEEEIDNVTKTVPKIIEEHTEVKLLETIRDCSVKQLCSSPTNENVKSTEIKESKIPNGVKKSLVDVEVHQLNSNNKTDLNNGMNGKKHNDLKLNEYDLEEDEGEGKSIEDDVEKSDENLKSNGTPTSGIVDDEDDSFLCSSANNLNNLINTDNSNNFNLKTDLKFNNDDLLKEWNKNDTEIKTTESANNSTIDNIGDITVDSVKEHFNNLSIRQNVDLLLDHNDDHHYN